MTQTIHTTKAEAQKYWDWIEYVDEQKANSNYVPLMPSDVEKIVTRWINSLEEPVTINAMTFPITVKYGDMDALINEFNARTEYYLEYFDRSFVDVEIEGKHYQALSAELANGKSIYFYYDPDANTWKWTYAPAR